MNKPHVDCDCCCEDCYDWNVKRIKKLEYVPQHPKESRPEYETLKAERDALKELVECVALVPNINWLYSVHKTWDETEWFDRAQALITPNGEQTDERT